MNTNDFCMTDKSLIALDEIRHFEILAKIMRNNDSTADIQGLMMRHNSLLAKLA